MKLLAILLATYTLAGSLDAHATLVATSACEVATSDYKVCLHTGKLRGVQMDEQECYENTVGATDDCLAEEEEDFSDSGVGCVDDCMDTEQEIFNQ